MSQILGQTLSLTSVAGAAGVTIIPPGSRLTRLHYFDGKFLRASHLEVEQRYLQALVQLSNQAGGPGIVHGFSTVLGAGTLEIGEGLAIDPQGRVLLLPSPESVSIAELLSASRRPAGALPYGDDHIARPAALPSHVHQPVMRSYVSTAIDYSTAGFVLSDPIARRAREGEFGDCEVRSSDGPNRVSQPSDLYLIVVAHAEALCGHEDVYGRLCEAACTTRSERPYAVEGIVVRAIPLNLDVTLGQIGPIVLNVHHLRSRVASAYFAHEATLIASLISKAGLSSATWCLGAEALGGFGVPIGVLGRAGDTTTFFDAWIARRERMEAPPRKYWAWRMAMRPWDVFLAHVLQFQCQLHELFMEAPLPGDTDPCREGRGLIDEASGALSMLRDYYAKVTGVLARMALPADNEFAKVDVLKDRIGGYDTLLGKLEIARKGLSVGDRILIRGGIVELPSAGYLPVAPSADVPVNTQVRNLLGEGVDLRFCIVRPDFVPHALEEAQHMDRISLLQGLANPQDRPKVDILVPNGEFVEESAKTAGMAFAGKARFVTKFAIGAASGSVAVAGAARGEVLAGGGVAFHFAGIGRAPDNAELGTFVRRETNFNDVRERGEFGGIESADPEIPEGVFRVREAVRRIAPMRVVGWEAGGAVRGTPEGIPPAVLDQPTTNKVSALWATLRSDQDPFALQVGQDASLNGRLIMVVPTSRASLVDITMRGAVRVSDVTPSVLVTDRCRGFVTLDVVWKGLFGNAPVEQHDRVEATIELERLDRAEGSRVVATISFGAEGIRRAMTLAFETEWLGSPVAAKCIGSIGFGDRSERVLESQFKENADVLTPGNADHDLAETALDVIDAVLAEPAFKANAEQLLFPPAKAPTREQTLRATLDWVLFHRRRDKDCGGKAAVVEIKTRRYKVYSGVLKEVDQWKDVLEALQKNQPPQLKRAQFVPAGVVEFAGGSSNLLTPATTLANQWQNVGHGNRIILAAVANQGDAIQDGEALSMARLRQLELALDPLGMKIDAHASSRMLPAVPEPTLPADDTDGIIAIVTYKFVDVRRARVVLYRPAGLDAVRRVTNRPLAHAVVPLPDLKLRFEDNAVVEDDDARQLLKILHEMTVQAGEGFVRLDLAPPEALDMNAHKRATSAADYIRRTPVNSVAGAPYSLLDPHAPWATRALHQQNPDERPFLEEAGDRVNEIIALHFRD